MHILPFERVGLQRHFLGCGDKNLVLLEGRDSAGKDGGSKRIVQTLSPRETRVDALGKPSDQEHGAWYFHEGQKAEFVQPDTNVAFEFTPECIAAQWLAH